MSATFFVAIFQQQQKGSPKKVQMRINQELNFGFLNYDRPIFGLFYFYAKFFVRHFFSCLKKVQTRIVQDLNFGSLKYDRPSRQMAATVIPMFSHFPQISHLFSQPWKIIFTFPEIISVCRKT